MTNQEKDTKAFIGYLVNIYNIPLEESINASKHVGAIYATSARNWLYDKHRKQLEPINGWIWYD